MKDRRGANAAAHESGQDSSRGTIHHGVDVFRQVKSLQCVVSLHLQFRNAMGEEAIVVQLALVVRYAWSLYNTTCLAGMAVRGE